MTRIDLNSIKALVKTEATTSFAIKKVSDGCLFHSRWFAFCVPESEILTHTFGTPEPEADAWQTIAWPNGAAFHRAHPITKMMPDGEKLIRFVVPADDKVVAHMRGSVFDWIQTHFETPEFWVRGVNEVIAVKVNGVLVGGVGAARLKPTKTELAGVAPVETVAGT